MCFIDESASPATSVPNAVVAAGFIPLPPNLKFIVQGGHVNTLPGAPNTAAMCSLKFFCGAGGVTRIIDPKINLTNPLLTMLGPGMYPMPTQPKPNFLIMS